MTWNFLNQVFKGDKPENTISVPFLEFLNQFAVQTTALG